MRDYVIVNERAYENVIEMRIGEAVDSNHAPLQGRLKDVQWEKEEDEEERVYVD